MLNLTALTLGKQTLNVYHKLINTVVDFIRFTDTSSIS
jgi:hypothetical protein